MAVMQMTNGEILTSYKQSKNKSEQIGILAELNACHWEEIADILSAGGIQFQEKKKAHQDAPVNRLEKSKRDRLEVIQLLGQGYTAQEVAEHRGCSVNNLYAFCHRHGIKIKSFSSTPQIPNSNKKRTSSAATEPVQVQTSTPNSKRVHSSTKAERVQGLSMINNLSLLLGFVGDWLGRDTVIECGAREEAAVLVLSVDGLPYRLRFERLEGL